MAQDSVEDSDEDNEDDLGDGNETDEEELVAEDEIDHSYSTSTSD